MDDGKWESRPSPERIAEVVALTAGRGGRGDENSLTDSGWGETILVYCGQGSRAARMLKRCGSAVWRMRVITNPDESTSVMFEVERSAFRGVEYAFRNVDSRGPAMTDAQKAALRGGA